MSTKEPRIIKRLIDKVEDEIDDLKKNKRMLCQTEYARKLDEYEQKLTRLERELKLSQRSRSGG